MAGDGLEEQGVPAYVLFFAGVGSCLVILVLVLRYISYITYLASVNSL